jgi:hypothetical protein
MALRTVKIENKSYDITISDEADNVLAKALDDLGEHNITAKALLKAYLQRSIEYQELKDELDRIEKAIEEV